jgi:hypothetical protein
MWAWYVQVGEAALMTGVSVVSAPRLFNLVVLGLGNTEVQDLWISPRMT